LKIYRTHEEELQGLVEQLNAILKLQRNSCVVIARNNKLLTSAKDYLKNAGINAEIVKKKQDFETPPMRFFYGLLKLANSPESRSQLNKICSALNDFLNIELSAEEIASKAALENKTLFSCFLSSISQYKELSDVRDLAQTYLYDCMNYKEFIEQVFDSNLFKNLSKEEQDDPEKILTDYGDEKGIWDTQYSRVCRNFDTSLTLHILLQEIDLTPKAITLSHDCVQLHTVHTAKGTEFEHVYIIGLVEDYFPTFQAKKKGDYSKAMEEERRNCFVAITRSSGTLYMSYAKKYFGRDKEPSRFLKEMGIQ